MSVPPDSLRKPAAGVDLLPVPAEALAVAPATPMGLLALAVSQGADVEKLEKLMALQERWEANEARKAFVVALSAFKASPPVVFKSKQVSFGDTSYKHALLSDAVELIGAALAVHGLSFRWETEQIDGGMVRVSCVLTHVLGHSERVTLQAGLDASGKKNNIQSLGSTVAYLERYTLFAVTGTAAKDMDDDGKGSESSGLDESVKADYLASIEALVDKEAGAKLLKQIAASCKAVSDTDAYAILKAALIAKLEEVKA